MKKATTAQLQKLHIMLHQLGLNNEKQNLVYSISKGRTVSSKELTLAEAKLLIESLVTDDPNERMRKKVFALAYEAGIIWGDTFEDKKMNAAKLNLFLQERGTVKKLLNKMTSAELTKVVTQFSQMLKRIQETAAKKATKNLLDEMQIEVESDKQTHY